MRFWNFIKRYKFKKSLDGWKWIIECPHYIAPTEVTMIIKKWNNMDGNLDDRCAMCPEQPYIPDCDEHFPCPYVLGGEDQYDDDIYDADEWDDPCLNCGMWCEYWLGDNLCELEINRQVEIEDLFYERFVSDIHCPVCGKELQQIALPTSRLWVWPGGDWEFAGEAMLGLKYFGTLQTPKGVIHETTDDDCRYVHVWRGDKKHQFLMKLLKTESEDK